MSPDDRDLVALSSRDARATSGGASAGALAPPGQ